MLYNFNQCDKLFNSNNNTSLEFALTEAKWEKGLKLYLACTAHEKKEKIASQT